MIMYNVDRNWQENCRRSIVKKKKKQFEIWDEYLFETAVMTLEAPVLRSVFVLID